MSFDQEIDINPRNLRKSIDLNYEAKPKYTLTASTKDIEDALKFVRMYLEEIDGKFKIEVYKGLE